MISNQAMQVGETELYKTFQKEFRGNLSFMEDFADLMRYDGRVISFIGEKGVYNITPLLLENATRTLKSIELCCSIGSFADANTLTRKLRDDLVLFIYILDVANKREPFVKEDVEKLQTNDSDSFAKSFSNIRLNSNLTDDEKAVEAWLNNSVHILPRNIKMKLSFENYMKFLRRDTNIEQVLTKYKLEEYWETLRTKLNNYVHNNGMQFAAHNLFTSDSQHLATLLSNINVRTSYVISFFLILIIIVDGISIGSTDMLDYLDAGMEPPEGCQYEIAGFVQEYIDQKVVVLHPELKEYLRDNNRYGMRIS